MNRPLYGICSPPCTVLSWILIFFKIDAYSKTWNTITRYIKVDPALYTKCRAIYRNGWLWLFRLKPKKAATSYSKWIMFRRILIMTMCIIIFLIRKSERTSLINLPMKISWPTGWTATGKYRFHPSCCKHRQSGSRQQVVFLWWFCIWQRGGDPANWYYRKAGKHALITTIKNQPGKWLQLGYNTPVNPSLLKTFARKFYTGIWYRNGWRFWFPVPAEPACYHKHPTWPQLTVLNATVAMAVRLPLKLFRAMNGTIIIIITWVYCGCVSIPAGTQYAEFFRWPGILNTPAGIYQ